MHQLGPGDPLPPFNFKYEHASGQVAPDGTLTVTGGAVFTMGDVRISADNWLVRGIGGEDQLPHIEANGHVVMTRGDETFRGVSFVLDLQDATFVAENAAVISPPLYLQAAHIHRYEDHTDADDAEIATGTTSGASEVKAHAQRATIVLGQTLKMTNVAISLYGVQLFTLRRLTIKLASRPGTGQNGTLEMPLIVRNSTESGQAFGLNHSFELYRGVGVKATVVETTLQGVEYLLNLHYTLAHRNGPLGRRRFGLEETESRAPGAPPADPLREFLKARPLPYVPDSVIDFVDITTTLDPLSQPSKDAPADLSIATNISRRQEIDSQRQGPILVSRSPELVLNGQLPLTETAVVQEDSLARAALHTPRLALIGTAELGSYEEEQLFGNHADINEDRFGVVGGIKTLPLLIGSRLLAQAQSTFNVFRYQDGQSYHFVETSLNGDYIFGERTMIGASYISRGQGGGTPFYFDQVDTQDEGQIRAETNLGSHRRYTLAAVGRYDLSQHQFFDYEIDFAIRGHNFEPRFAYHRLSRQFGVTFSLPGITAP